jgi:hypothetical protein
MRSEIEPERTKVRLLGNKTALLSEGESALRSSNCKKERENMSDKRND